MLGLVPIGLVLVAAGALVIVGGATIGYVIVGLSIAFIGALALGMGLGVRRSLVLDRQEAALDAAIRATVGPCGNECTDSCETDCAVKTLPRL